MIGYLTLGSNDIDRSLAFYDALMAELGAKRLMSSDEGQAFTFYGTAMDRPMVAICRPFDGEAARPGNGPMVGLAAKSREQVDRVHAAALELGAQDEGAPGIRPPEDMGFYGAYFRDPDGNKLCVFVTG